MGYTGRCVACIVICGVGVGRSRRLGALEMTGVSHWNDNPEPFVWTKPADEILDKVARGQATLDRIAKSATHH